MTAVTPQTRQNESGLMSESLALQCEVTDEAKSSLLHVAGNKVLQYDTHDHAVQ